MNYLSLVFVMVCCFASLNAKAENVDAKEYQKFFDMLETTRYNTKIPAQGNKGYGSPIEVRCTMYIIDVFKINPHERDYQISFYFRQKWNDSRLAYPQLDLSDPIIIRDPSVIWTPDLFFVREKSASIHTVVNANTFIRINPNGEVHYSNRYTATSSCRMNFDAFPHDIQKCIFNIESYGYTVDRLNLSWDNSSYNPVTFDHEMDMFPYNLGSVMHTEKVVNFTITGLRFKALELELTFEHRTEFFVSKLYVPSLFFVALAWLSFWISTKMLALRLSLLLVTLFLMVRTGFYIDCYVPDLPYATGVDVWVGVCEALIFAAFLEFIAVSIMKKTVHKSGKIACKNDLEAPALLESCQTKKDAVGNGTTIGSAVIVIASRLKGDDQIHKRIDKAFRILYPILFLFFNFVYFLLY